MKQDDEPIAFYQGFPSIEILDIDYSIDDQVIWRYSGEKKKHHTKIYYKSDSSYFMADKFRIDLGQCLRS